MKFSFCKYKVISTTKTEKKPFSLLTFLLSKKKESSSSITDDDKKHEVTSTSMVDDCAFNQEKRITRSKPINIFSSRESLALLDVRPESVFACGKQLMFDQDIIKELTATCEKGRFYQNSVLMNGTYMYVLNEEKKLVAFPESFRAANALVAKYHLHDLHRLYHPCLAEGFLVYCAGHIDFEKGKIVRIDNYSGHYAPSSSHLLNAIEILREEYNLSYKIRPEYRQD